MLAIISQFNIISQSGVENLNLKVLFENCFNWKFYRKMKITWKITLISVISLFRKIHDIREKERWNISDPGKDSRSESRREEKISWL